MITNGFPKSGNHALVKACQLLGWPCEVNHLPYSQPLSVKHLYIKRDPRNVLLSWVRQRGLPVTPGTVLSSLRRFDSKSLPEELSDYEPWLNDPGTLVIRYESLIASDDEMRRIAAYLETPYIDGAWEQLPGMTRTWFARHSDYTEVWTSDVQATWKARKGHELLDRWGYV